MNKRPPGKEQVKDNESYFNFSILLYAAVSVAIVVLLFDYVKPSADEPVSYLSYFIYFIGVIGLYVFYKSYARVRDEKRCVILAYKESEKNLFQVKSGSLEFHLYQFKELGTKNEELSINRILSHIYTEAESKKFDSSLVILNSYKEEFVTKTIRLFGFQKVALQLGILGTFIGLAMAFKDIGGANIDDHVINHLIRSLKIPFSASIAGLQVAFILWLHIDYLNRQQENLFKVMEKCVDALLNLARHAIYKNSITVELQHVSSRMDEISGKIEKGNELLYSQNSQISEGIGRLRTANSDLNLFLNGIEKQQQDFLISVKSLYDSLSPELISKELKGSLSNGAMEISEMMSKHLDNTLSKYSVVENSILTMNNHFKEFQIYLETQVKQGDESILRHKQEIFESVSQIVEMQKKYIEQVSKVDVKEDVKKIFSSFANNISAELKQSFDKLIPEVSGLAKGIAAYNERADKKAFWKWNPFSGLFKK
ncbi:MAG: MotA/TolQ/ExbB proton channel family protein [Ferruginibacter sp.]